MRIKGIDEQSSGIIKKNFKQKDKTSYFTMTPQIVPAGKRSLIEIKSRYDYMELEGEYLVLINPYYDYDYLAFSEYRDEVMRAEARDGVLSIPYDFEKEDMYRIIVAEQLGSDINLILHSAIYALDEDLLEYSPLLGDFHSHTICSDGLESPKLVVHSAIEKGLDFLAITDHNSYEGSALAEQYVREMNLPLTIINGEEYTSSFTNMHIISLGHKTPLPAECYCMEPLKEVTEETAFACTRKLVEKIHENGGLGVMCHMMWKPFGRDGSRGDVPLSLVESLLKAELFDGVEIVSGSPAGDAMTTLMQYQIVRDCGLSGDAIAFLGTTDSHSYSNGDICGRHMTLVLAEENTQEGILEAVRRKRTVAVQLLDGHNALCFGSTRLCRFAQFYLQYILHVIG